MMVEMSRDLFFWWFGGSPCNKVVGVKVVAISIIEVWLGIVADLIYVGSVIRDILLFGC